MGIATFILTLVNMILITGLAIATIIMNKKIEKFKIVEEQIREKKKAVYTEFAKIFLKPITDRAFRENIKKDPEKFNKLVVENAPELTFFGSLEVLKKYSEFREYGKGNRSRDPGLMRKFGAVIIAMREDLGDEESGFSTDDFLKLFITDWEEYATI